MITKVERHVRHNLSPTASPPDKSTFVGLLLQLPPQWNFKNGSIALRIKLNHYFNYYMSDFSHLCFLKQLLLLACWYGRIVLRCQSFCFPSVSTMTSNPLLITILVVSLVFTWNAAFKNVTQKETINFCFIPTM